jgi:inner membrane protein
METKRKFDGKFTQSLTFKAIASAVLILLLLVPNGMIQDLIWERRYRSNETIEKINEKWSHAQTVCGPVINIPYTTTYQTDVSGSTEKKTQTEKHELHITPEDLNVQAQLFPEVRHYGIYKTILYKSKIHVIGKFTPLDNMKIDNSVLHFDKTYISLGLTDLRGVDNRLEFHLNGKSYPAAAGWNDPNIGTYLIITPDDTAFTSELGKDILFDFVLDLKGSSSLSFIPIGSQSKVEISGDWDSPSFIGNFSPDYDMTDGFKASWSVLSFNRSIPGAWTDSEIESLKDTSFGVNLVNPVDHYQQNMRSAKYSLMFIVLTFVVFFFVEVLTKKRIHPLQYLLVGIALILFYSLLLSISEQLNFGYAYLIASGATISLISLYANSIFKNKVHAGILAVILCFLYIFLYVILQLEDMALLIGSIGLFTILGIIMYVSQKIKWYKLEEDEAKKAELPVDFPPVPADR